VFLTPARPVLEANTFQEANRVAVELTAKGVSMQAYGIRARILEAEPFARGDPRIVEVHPEVSFTALNHGVPIAASKASWVGAPLRRRLLATAGIDLPDDLGEASGVPVDDVLDAAIAAWSAMRVARGEYETLPDPPEVLRDGITAASARPTWGCGGSASRMGDRKSRWSLGLRLSPRPTDFDSELCARRGSELAVRFSGDGSGWSPR
jgi:predicted RNase H-like nuclease